jgi:predicted nucleotidyltransferase
MVHLFKLSKIFGKVTEILLVLIDMGDEEVYVSELRSKLKTSKSTIIKWLDLLKMSGFVKDRKRGNMHYYKLDQENPIIKQIKVLLNVTLLMQLVSSLKGKAEVYLYGSSARGENRPDSDYDLLIITETSPKDIFKILKIEAKVDNREINLMIIKPFEYAKLAKTDPALYQRIEIDKIRLV